MYIKKRTVAILIVVALLVGAAGTAFFAKSGISGMFLTRSEYEELEYYEKTYGKLDSMKRFLETNYYEKFDSSKLLESAYYGLVEGLEDPYSQYLNADEYQEMIDSLSGSETFGGIGVTFRSLVTEKGFYIMAVNVYGPAHDAGIRKGDYIVSINGESVLDFDGDALSAAIRGEVGTEVCVGIARGTYLKEYKLIRAQITSYSVSYDMLDSDLCRGRKIAYIDIDSFDSDTGDIFEKAVKWAEKEKAEGIVIDLRDNGGGLVATSLQVADVLLNKATVVTVKDVNGNASSYQTEDGKTSLPYVLLVNENTASASEILSAGIQDNKGGKIVGTLTYGKGIIQNYKKLTDGSAIKYTELQYFSPSGNAIHKVGITPDYVVEITEDDYDKDMILIRDAQLEKAISILLEGE